MLGPLVRGLASLESPRLPCQSSLPMNSEHRSSSSHQYDPVFLHARREALVILVAWFSCLVWSVTYCVLFGYRPVTGQIETVFGIPHWVVWGIVAPWLVADVFAVWFCFVYTADDDLGEAHEDLDLKDGPPGTDAIAAEPRDV